MIRLKFNITENACLQAHVFLMYIRPLYIKNVHQKCILLYASAYGIIQDKKINKSMEKS